MHITKHNAPYNRGWMFTRALMVPNKFSNWLSTNLQRSTASGKFIAEVDGLRFFAIFWVVLYHLNGYLVAHANSGHLTCQPESSFAYWLCSIGFFGVKLLFVLSGFMFFFMIKHDASGNPFITLKDYYVRRIARLIPPYQISLLIVFVSIAFYTGAHKPEGLFLSWLANAFFSSVLFSGHLSQTNVAAWAMEVIIQFYAIAPILILLFRIKKTYFRWGVIVILIFIIIVGRKVIGIETFKYCVLLGFIEWFLCGILVADICCHFQSLRKHWVFDFIGFSSWFFIILIPHIFTRGLLLQGTMMAVILPAYYCIFRGPLLNRIFSNGLLVTMGGMCYTVYLYHFLIISAAGRFFNHYFIFRNYDLYFLVHAFFILTVVIFSCTILFILFEKPFMSREWSKKAGIFLNAIMGKK